MKMKMKTYNEWQREGFHVIRGRKASGRNQEGKCVFSEVDVEEYMDADGEDYDHPMESFLQSEFG